MPPGQVKTNHLARSMNAAVRSPGSHDRNDPARHRRQRCFQRALNRDLIFTLPLETKVLCAIVLD